MKHRIPIVARAVVTLHALCVMIACGQTEAPRIAPERDEPEQPEAPPDRGEANERPREPAADGASLPNGLLLGYSVFAGSTPQPALLEILVREGGEWRVSSFTDPSSNVFHKALVLDPPEGEPGILTLGGMGAALKLWRRDGDQWRATALWETEFGGRFNRMRDAEVADLFGDGRPALAVATHDQGVVAVIRQEGTAWNVRELDRTPNTFVHEIEIGDLNGDGTLEIYATPSEPNNLGGGEQHGEVVRYVPRDPNGARTVVADLGNRHAKEIWVGDADGDGRDELYVAVEALTRGQDPNVEIVEPVEIRRYDADTAPTGGVVIARIDDRLTRFLTVGDVDGDGRREMFAASFSSGVWMLKPGRDPRAEWSIERIDPDSAGFEHAAICADLDGDGTDELYVAADRQGEVRRYVWANGRSRREVIHRRDDAGAYMTWNITPVPAALVR